MGADPGESGVEGVGLDGGGAVGLIENGVVDVAIAEGGLLAGKSASQKSSQQGECDNGPTRWAGGAESQKDGATEGGEGQNEAVVPNVGVEEDFGGEEKGKGGEGEGERKTLVQV